jgi:hypothetical protein
LTIDFGDRLGSLKIVHRDLSGAAIFRGIEGHLLPFNKSAYSSALERSGVDEYVFAAVIWLNETEALLTIVKLYGT